MYIHMFFNIFSMPKTSKSPHHRFFKCQVTYLHHRPRQWPRRSKLPQARRDPKGWLRKNPSYLSPTWKSPKSTCHVGHVGVGFCWRNRFSGFPCGLVFVGWAVCLKSGKGNREFPKKKKKGNKSLRCKGCSRCWWANTFVSPLMLHQKTSVRQQTTPPRGSVVKIHSNVRQKSNRATSFDQWQVHYVPPPTNNTEKINKTNTKYSGLHIGSV